MERWRMADPFKVVASIQAKEQRSKRAKAHIAMQEAENLFKRASMTQDESDQVETLLEVWYRYERSYTPALGAPRASVSCREHRSGDVHQTGDDRDALLDKLTSNAVSACIDELPVMDRAAIGVHCRNRWAGVSVHRNPRIEDQHRAYQSAKAALWPKLRRKGLMK